MIRQHFTSSIGLPFTVGIALSAFFIWTTHATAQREYKEDAPQRYHDMVQEAAAQDLIKPAGNLYKENEIIVKWKDELKENDPEEKLAATIQEYGTRKLRRAATYITKDNPKRNFSVVSSPYLSTEELIEQFEDLPNVEYVHENVIFTAQAQVVPWGMGDSAGVKAQTANTEGQTGSGVVVAVIDTGVDLDHEDLDANLWSPTNNDCTMSGVVTSGGCPNHGYDFSNTDNDPTDDNGHGTHVAGTVAAENNSVGVVGVAPNAKIMAIKALAANGSGDYADIVSGIDFAVDNGADIINMSLGAMGTGIVLIDLQLAIADAETAGVTVVAASGNYSSNIQFIPSSFETVISVGAVQETATQVNPTENFNTRLSYFSNWGNVDVVAPGSAINSTTYDGSYSGDTWYGTSMASPHVAGVATLLIGKRSTLTPEQIRHIIEKTATDMGDAGKDEFFGSGLVNADTALDKTSDSSTKTILLEGNWTKNSTTAYSTSYNYEPTVYSTMLPADGTSTTTMRVRVRTEDGDAVATESVSLSTTSGTITTPSPVTTDSNGNAEFTVKSASTAGDATITATIVSTGAASSVAVRYADTLLVTDAGQPTSPGNDGWFYYQALETNGVNWKASTAAYPSLDTSLSLYKSVVWHTEGYSLNSTEQSNIKSYLDAGGNIFISGGDIAYTYYYYNKNGGASTLAQDTILSAYLKISYSDYIASDLTLSGDGSFNGVGAELTDYGEDTDNFYYSDVITAQDGGTVQGYFCSNEESALVTVDSTYNSVFLGVALETVAKTYREEIIDNALDFLNGSTLSGGSFTAPSECDTTTTADDGLGTDPSEEESTDSGTGEEAEEEVEPTPGVPDEVPDLGNPEVLTDLSVDEVSDTSATVSWETDESIESSIIYAEKAETGETEAVGVGDISTATIDDLVPNTQYQFSVYGVYADDTWTSASTITGITLPAAPSTPAIQSKTRSAVTVELEDPNSTGYQFRVELRNKEKTEILATSTLEVGDSTVTFSNLTPNTIYYVRAQLGYANTDGEEVLSDYSSDKKVTTYSDQVQKPKVLKKKKVKVKIQWEKPEESSIEKYKIQVWKRSSGEYSLIQAIKVKKQLKKSKKTHWIKNLSPQKHYRVRIRATFKDGTIGTYSKFIKFRTRKDG